MSGLVGFGAVVAGHKLGLDYAGRLLAMTFILVVIGADGRAGVASQLLVPLHTLHFFEQHRTDGRLLSYADLIRQHISARSDDIQ